MLESDIKWYKMIFPNSLNLKNIIVLDEQLQNRINKEVHRFESIVKFWNKSYGNLFPSCMLLMILSIFVGFVVYKQYFCFPLIWVIQIYDQCWAVTQKLLALLQLSASQELLSLSDVVNSPSSYPTEFSKKKCFSFQLSCPLSVNWKIVFHWHRSKC